MSKYKLIKKYPGSPELGSILTESSENCRMYPTEECMKNYPEFWEEVVEKDYEILSWYFGDMNITKDPDGSAKEYFIYSVKRLSDNEIFIIGDKVIENVTGQKDFWIISEFSLKDSRCFSCGVNINNIEKVKEPLFITEDGYEIFEGNECWEVLENYEIYKVKIKSIETFIAGLEKGNRKTFKCKENAEKWVEENKPKYSEKQIRKTLEKYFNLNTPFVCASTRELMNIKITNEILDRLKWLKQMMD